MRRSSAVLAILWLLVACDPVARGDRAWEADDPAEAAQAWLAADGLDADHQARLARAQIRLGQLDQAALTLDALPHDQRTAEGHLASGLLLLHLGELPQASSAFGAGLALAPLPALLVNQCTALGQLSHLTALAVCQEAIEADPEDPRPYLGLAAASVADLPDAALEALGIAMTRLGPAGSAQRTELAPWVGELWRGLGDHGAACRWGLEGGAGDLDTAQSCLVSGEVGAARPLLEVLADQEPGHVAQRLLFQLDLDVAEQATAGPDRVQALAAADRWHRRLVASMADSQDPGWLNDLGRLAWLEERPGDAEALWAAALALAPAEAAPRLNLAKALERRGRGPEARALLEAATAAGTAGPAALGVALALARLELRSGLASQAWERLSALHGGCLETGQVACAARAALELARLEAGAGRTQDAIDHLEQAIAYGGSALRADVGMDTAFDALRDDLRYRQLIADD